MPEKIERQLKKSARKKGLTGKRRAAFIFGTLTKIEKRRKAKR